MGTILAMRRGLILSLLLVLAACGRPDFDPRLAVSRTLIEQSTTPLLFVEVPDLGGGGVIRPSGQNGDVATWRTPDQRSFSFRDGVLVGTRGLGFDLMSADVSGTLAAISGASGEYALFHTTLDGRNKTVFRSFACTMASPVSETIDIFGSLHSVQRHDETCHAFGLSIQNTYWTGGGVMWKARQWVTEETGYLTSERLVL
jgi:hypothetical protein